jgi:D-glycero-D-manno-heptose 1,7-bisphosphate phosphatase
MGKKAAFFDRDGTLIVDYPYLSQLNQIQLLMPAIAIARLCQERGYTLFVVTNQSGVARGLFDENFVAQAHRHLHNLLLANGVCIEKYYYCPHHPELGVEPYKKKCICRKPASGMLEIAAHEHNINLADSLMFGNSECDLQAGLAAGCTSFSMPQLTTISLDEVAKVLFSGTIMKSVKDKY